MHDLGVRPDRATRLKILQLTCPALAPPMSIEQERLAGGFRRARVGSNSASHDDDGDDLLMDLRDSHLSILCQIAVQ